MTPLYTEIEFTNSKSTDKLPFECFCCKQIFFKEKKEITYEIKNKRGQIKYCSQKCANIQKSIFSNITCINCSKVVKRTPSAIQKSKRNFCSKSCAATYNNRNKKHGIRRSKLEHWIESQLNILYPKLKIHYNQKNAIGSELDIYIPTLNLAFELNGIFHYEPIFGIEKFQSIQNNDSFKFKSCFEKQIDLCIIDVSTLKYFKEKHLLKYLNIITNIIDSRNLFKG